MAYRFKKCFLSPPITCRKGSSTGVVLLAGAQKEVDGSQKSWFRIANHEGTQEAICHWYCNFSSQP